jgi:tripartite-type tricarboxylate transporter receptor subunit TctC
MLRWSASGRSGIRFLFAAWIACTFGTSVAAQSPKDFYASHQVNLYVGSSAGGPYDAYARLIGLYMEKYLPGSPHIIVRNMPGAGGIVAANFLVNAAEKDGASFALLQREAPMDPLMSGTETKAQYDPLSFTWIGTPNQEIGMVYMSEASGAKTIEDTQRREYSLAASGSTSGAAVYGRILNMLIGTKFKIILGYPGSPDALLAIDNGEADGRVTSGWAGSERSAVTEWVAKGKARLLMQISSRKSPDYPDLPYIMDFARNDGDRQVMQFLFTGQLIGNPFVAAPGIPADRAAALRDAFMKTMKDPQFMSDANTQLLNLDPLPGDDMLKVMQRAYATPVVLRQRALDIYNSAQK